MLESLQIFSSKADTKYKEALDLIKQLESDVAGLKEEIREGTFGKHIDNETKDEALLD